MICSYCREEKEISKGRICRICRNTKQKIRRQLNNNSITQKYEKTKKGFLMRLYRNMKSRITGIQKSKFHLYEGKELLDKETFNSWSLNNSTFHNLFKIWEISNYDRRLTPSVDRVNSDKGYSLDNLEWVTHSENSRRGSISKKRKTN